MDLSLSGGGGGSSEPRKSPMATAGLALYRYQSWYSTSFDILGHMHFLNSPILPGMSGWPVHAFYRPNLRQNKAQKYHE